MHKVQMNSGGFNPETVKKRIARFEEFDNGHVLRSYQKMSVADSEERARKASIDDPENVYYVSYDDIMEPCSDLYWFQGKSYDYAGVHKALSQYRKSGTSGLNSGRKSLNSSDEQVRVIGTVTIYSDFVDFKKSVSEHLLQTAVGSKAKLKFKWLGDNKVEVRAICSAEDERKVKILLENSDVTKTITWVTSGNSGRRRILGLNSGCDELVKKSSATLKRKLNSANDPESPFYTATDAANYFLGKDYTVEQIERYLKRKGYSDEWIRNMFDLIDEYADEQEDFDMFNSSRKNINSNRKVGNSSMRKVVFKGKLNSSRKPAQKAARKKLNSSSWYWDEWDKYCDSIPVTPEMQKAVDTWTEDEGFVVEKALVPRNRKVKKLLNSTDAVAMLFTRIPGGTSFDDEAIFGWSGKDVNDDLAPYNLTDIMEQAGVDWTDDESAMNSSRKPAQRAARKKLNSSKKSEILKLTGWSRDDLAEAFDQWIYDGGGEYEEDEQFDRFADAVAKSVERGDTEEYFGVELKASRKPAQRAARKKLNSSRDDIITELEEYYTHDEAVEYIDSFEEQTGAKATRLATPDEAEMYDGAFWAVKDGVEKLWCRGNGFWYKCKEDFDSSRKLNSSEEELGEPDEGVAADGSAAEGVDAHGVTAEDDVQDTGIDGGETAVETAELLEDALIVQNPETKEVSLFVATEEDEALPEFVDVIAEVTPVDEVAVLDSSRRLKKFATAKLNSSKGCLNSDAEDVCPGCGNPFDECTCEAGTVAYDEIQLPDDSIVEVENILVVKGEDDDLGLFMPDDADDIVPEDYEVVAVATPVAEVEVLDSSRRLKKAAAAKKLNSSVKRKVLNSAKQSLESKVKACLREAGLTASSVNQGTDMGLPVVNVIFRPKADWRADIDAYYKARTAYSDKYYDSSHVGGWLRDKEGYKDGPEATALNEAYEATAADAAAYAEEIKAAITPVLEAAGFDFSIRYFNECGASAPEQRYWGGSQVFLRVTDPDYQRQAKSGAAKVNNRNQSPERKLINSIQAYFEENGFGWDDRQVYRNAATTPGNYNIVIKGLSGAPDGTEAFIQKTAADIGLNIRRLVVGDRELRIGTGR